MLTLIKTAYNEDTTLSYEDAMDFDYARTTLHVGGSLVYLYDNDNCHGNPDAFFEGFFSALDLLHAEYEVVEKVLW